MSKVYIVDVGVTLPDDEFPTWKRINDLASDYDSYNVSGGTGFGCRDMQFEFEDAQDADACAKFLTDAYLENGFEAYVGVGTERRGWFYDRLWAVASKFKSSKPLDAVSHLTTRS